MFSGGGRFALTSRQTTAWQITVLAFRQRGAEQKFYIAITDQLVDRSITSFE